MTDYDADEPIKPLAPRSSRFMRFWSSDRVLGWSGVVLALSAAFFPWYVFFNEDKFGIYQASSSTTRSAPARSGQLVTNPSPGNLGLSEETAVLTPEDQIITGTVPKAEPEEDKAKDAQAEQPLPPQPLEFRLMHVFKGRAMIEDKTGVYLVRKGDTLPDLSRVADFEERDGIWVIVTDNGSVYDATGKRD